MRHLKPISKASEKVDAMGIVNILLAILGVVQPIITVVTSIKDVSARELES